MKTNCLILCACLIAATAVGQFRSSLDQDVLKEKRFQPLIVEQELFWMNTSTGDLWKFDRTEMRWAFIGSPRRADTKRKGTYQLKSLTPGELIILDTDSGEAWWTDQKTWIVIDDPSTRTRRDKK